MNRTRIPFIDAMRGTTMLLVVYSHICGFCLGDTEMGGNGILFLFRLPCFFFISGFLFCKPMRQWNLETVKHVVSRKSQQQLLPTLIFLLLLAPPPLFFSRLGATKGGYWFTFALFIFFCLNMVVERLLRPRLQLFFAMIVSVLAFCYDVFYNRYFAGGGLLTLLLGFLSFMTWRYYLFFYLGVEAKRHKEQFLMLTSKPQTPLLATVVFILIATAGHTESVGMAYLTFAVGGVSGMILVFSLFRQFYHGQCLVLEFVGRRTLDIYLLHYFLLPRFLLPYGEQLRGQNSILLEIGVVLVLALLVVMASLAVSYLLRKSTLLARILFGQLPDKQPE